MTSMNLYRRKAFLTSVALVLACLAVLGTLSAQHRNSHKLRATAVVEITTDAHGVAITHLIPVSLLEEGRFQDASVYKATPRPMALENGLVYEAQKTGTPVGYVTIINGANDHGWVALGKFKQVSTTPKVEATPTPAKGDDRPILRRSDNSGTGAATPTPTATPSPAPAGNSDDRPTLHRSDNSNSGAASPSPTATPTPPQAGQSPIQPEAPEDPNRPVLQHQTPGQPTVTMPPAKAAQPSQGAATSTKPVASTPGTQTAGTQMYVAVSDEQPVDIRSFNFSWKPGEEKEVEVKMRKLVVAQFQRENIRIAESALKNVVFRSFDLDLSNDAALVISAEVAGSNAAPGVKDAPAKSITRYITVVARLDFDGIPQKLMANITDSSRLDVTPRLELIDAVDVDGTGPAELLFREYNFDHKSFVIYSVGRNAATKMFEGANQPLK